MSLLWRRPERFPGVVIEAQPGFLHSRKCVLGGPIVQAVAERALDRRTRRACLHKLHQEFSPILVYDGTTSFSEGVVDEP